jgi:hypothetical protein
MLRTEMMAIVAEQEARIDRVGDSRNRDTIRSRIGIDSRHAGKGEVSPMTLDLPPFIQRPDEPNESICTKCFLTVRAEGFASLEDAQMAHQCEGRNLREAIEQPARC